MTLLITHSACLEHLTPPGHPERPDRLRAIEWVLKHDRFRYLVREQCPSAQLATIALCHPMEYIERIRRAVPQTGLVQLDDDTVLQPVVSRHPCVLQAVQFTPSTRLWLERRRTRSSRSAQQVIMRKLPLPWASAQCSDCGPSRAAELWRRTRGNRRFRCPPRQRLPADFLERSDGDVLLDSRDAALSGKWSLLRIYE
jgi:hypothetical protein